MADRPWTELYVSFCMKKFETPSLHLLGQALRANEYPHVNLVPRLEGVSHYLYLIASRTRLH
jgi:hypothetical protein